MPPTITALYTGLLAIVIIVLGARVAWRRNVARIGIGVREDTILLHRTRVHGNAIENIPLALLMLLLLELLGTTPNVLHGLGILLVLSRVAHAVGLSNNPGRSFGRIFGMAGTWGAIMVMAIMLIARFFGWVH